MHFSFVDVDNTLLKGYSQKHLIFYLVRKKVYRNYFLLCLVFVWFFLYKIKFVKNPKFAMNFLYKRFAGISVTEFKDLIDDFFSNCLVKYMYKDGDLFLKLLKKRGEVILISTSISFIVEKIREYYDLDGILASDLNIEGGRLTGKIDSVLYSDKKYEALLNYLLKRDALDATLTICSDHISDLSLLKHAQEALVVNPDKKMQKISRKLNYRIITLN